MAARPPKKAQTAQATVAEANLGRPNSEAQWKAFTAEQKYICYGGARGGGKSWFIQRKAPLLCYNYPGIRILILRREYPDMENTIISPMLKCLAKGSYRYNKSDHMLTFTNGSIIKFGNMPGYDSAVQGKYQGQEYDVLFIDEATQFLETEFRGLCAIVRGANGWYDRTDGSVHVDLYAGAGGEGLMMYTLSHELTHYLRDHSPAKFKALSDFLFEAYASHGQSAQQLIEKKLDTVYRSHGNISETLAYDIAYEEVVADSMETMLTDGKVLRQLQKQDRTIWELIRDYVTDLVDKIRAIYQDLKPDSVEGRKVAEMLDSFEQIQKLFAEGLIDAAENGASTEKSTVQKDGVRYQFLGYDKESGRGIYRSNFPIGTPKAAKSERILNYIQNIWSKKPIDLRIQNEDGSYRQIQAKFDPTYSEDENSRTDAAKLMTGTKHGSAKEKRVTLDLADDYYQIASESVYNYSKAETGKSTATHNDVKTWHYFVNDIMFQQDKNSPLEPYRVTVNIKEKTDGTYVYSFNAEIEKEGESTRRTLHADVNNNTVIANASPSEFMVTQSDDESQEKKCVSPCALRWSR